IYPLHLLGLLLTPLVARPAQERVAADRKRLDNLVIRQHVPPANRVPLLLFGRELLPVLGVPPDGKHQQFLLGLDLRHDARDVLNAGRLVRFPPMVAVDQYSVLANLDGGQKLQVLGVLLDLLRVRLEPRVEVLTKHHFARLDRIHLPPLPRVEVPSCRQKERAATHEGKLPPQFPAAEAGKLEPTVYFLLSPKGDWVKSAPCSPPASTE